MAADRWLSAVIALAAAAIAAAFLALDPAMALPLEAAWRSLIAAASAGAMLVAAAGGGGALLALISPALLAEEDSGLYALMAGILLWGMGALLLAVLGLFGMGGIIGLSAALSVGWLARPSLRLPSIPPLGWAAISLVLVVGLIDAFAPPIETDELYYHLAVPAKMLREGGLVGGVLAADGSRPMILHLPYACLLALGGDQAPRLLHLALTVSLLMGCISVGRRHLSERAGVLSAVALAGSWSVIHESGLASNNLPVSLAALLAMDAALRREKAATAILLGLALSIKYTAAGAAAAVVLSARVSWPARVAIGVGALALVAPWWLVNLAEGLHPLFPFAGWSGDMSFEYLEKYGFGRGLFDILLLPWRAVMSAEIDSFRLLGRLSPLLLAMLPAALWSARSRPVVRRFLLAGAVSVMVWALGPHWLRYLLPALPIIALACAAGVDRLTGWGDRALLACFLAGVPANLGPLVPRLADRLPAALGQESRAAYLERNEDTWPAMDWANRTLPDEARVALLYTWTGYLLQRDYVLGSVEDHIPVRHWLMTHGEDSLTALRSAGVTHLIVGRIGFLPKTYPFLSKADFQESFVDPLEQLDALLLAEAVLIHEARRVRVFRLPEGKNTAQP